MTTILYPQYFQKIQSACFTLCIVLLVSLFGLRWFQQLACVFNDEITLCKVSPCHHASTLAPAVGLDADSDIGECHTDPSKLPLEFCLVLRINTEKGAKKYGQKY